MELVIGHNELNIMKPSDIIDLAIIDYNEFISKPNHSIDMGVWMDTRNDVCKACLAGTILFKRFGKDTKILFDLKFRRSLHSPEPYIHKWMVFLDDVRNGFISEGLFKFKERLDKDKRKVIKRFEMKYNNFIELIKYEDDIPDNYMFIRYLQDLSKMLKGICL